MDQRQTPAAEANLQPPPSRPLRYGWLILSAWMVLVFFGVNFGLQGRVSLGLEIYLFQPVLWLSMAGLVWYLVSRERSSFSLLKRKDILLSGVMLGIIQVGLSVILGLVVGFGSSPYSHAFLQLVLNLGLVASRLVGIEVARWYLEGGPVKQHQGIRFFLAWLLPLALMIPAGQYSLFGSPESSFRLVGQTLLPAAAQSLFATTLVAAGGPLASIGYLGSLQVFEWLSPILPDLPWMAAAFVNVLVPLAGLLLLSQPESAPQNAAETPKKSKSERAPVTSWLLVGFLAVGILWFNSGMFGVSPFLVSGSSMNPSLYTGDIVVTRLTPPEEVQVGDIIRFNRDGAYVVHRVIEIQETGQGRVFITRGDNNDVDDGPVTPAQYEGKSILVIPKIGLIGVGVRLIFQGIRGG